MQADFIRCPHCRNAVALDANLAGMTVSCPHCSRPFAMPTLTSRAFTGADDLLGGMFEGGTALPPEEMSQSPLPDPVFQMHLDDVIPMVKAFLKLKPHEVKPEHVEFKMLPELQKRMVKAQRDLAAWQNVLKEVAAQELEMSEYRKQAWKKRDACLAKTPPDLVAAEHWNTEMIRWEEAFFNHQEPGVVDPDTHTAPKGMHEVKRVLNVLIAKAARRLKKYQDKYQHAADILNDPANGKFVPQDPGHAFTEQGEYEEDPSTMVFDADGIYWIPDGKGGRTPYLYKDPRNPGARPRPYNYQNVKNSLKRLWLRWFGG